MDELEKYLDEKIKGAVTLIAIGNLSKRDLQKTKGLMLGYRDSLKKLKELK